MPKLPSGVTPTEKMLADFCQRSFLKLWSYPNPYKDDGHELCDLLAIFGNYVFIFFDRENQLPETSDKDPNVLWDRWKRNVIDRQVTTAHGAERYIRSGRPIFLDAMNVTPFPFQFDRKASVVHKIIVAHGAKAACERASPQNVYGSLGITYSESDGGPTESFHIEIDKRKPIHILDSHNMPIVLRELDTVSDFSAYLDEKMRAVSKFDYLSYCGEEDLLGHYLMNYDAATNRHVIGPKENGFNGFTIGEGEWYDFVQTELYKNTKKENQISYFWDELIQRACQHSLDGTLIGNANILHSETAIHEMVKEPRFVRRGLIQKMLAVFKSFPDKGTFVRQVTLLHSMELNVAYVLLQVRAPDTLRAEPDYREKRQAILEIACGAAKNKFPSLVKIIGIGIDAPKFSDGNTGEDFVLMRCETWSGKTRSQYEELNKDWNFFETSALQRFSDRVTQFVPPA